MSPQHVNSKIDRLNYELLYDYKTYGLHKVHVCAHVHFQEHILVASIFMIMFTHMILGGVSLDMEADY